MEQAAIDEARRGGGAPLAGVSKIEPLSTRIKLANGVGAVAFGVKDNGFAVFLLLYYNQVLGMDAALVSLALMLALFIDAFFDPLLGNLSDRTYTRWGRRLPWLYAAAVPLAVMWALLWAPPLGEEPSFWGLLTLAVAVRLLLSMVEVPSVALVPELTRDYDERTDLFRWRFLFAWAGGLFMLVLAYQVFLADGLLRAEGYRQFGLFGAALMLVAILGSALMLHRQIARLPAHKPPPFAFGKAFAEIKEAFSERAFLILAAGGIAAYVSQGITFALSNYLYLFVWNFSPATFTLYPLVLFASVLFVFVTVQPLHRRWGKPRAAAVMALIGLLFWLAPYILYLLGAWPRIGTFESSALVFLFLFVSNWAAVVTLLSSSSMVAEIVEAFEERTGRRAEGSFYAGNWFIQKCAGGIGIFAAGMILAAAGLPEGATPGAVPSGVVEALILIYGAAVLLLALITAFWYVRFPIKREDHERRLAALAAEAARTPSGTGATPP